MDFYTTFLNSSKHPKDMWRDRLQDLINKQFENSSTYQTDVEEEIAFGTLKFKPIIARVTTLVDAKTGQRINDDYRKLIFKDMSYMPEIGTRYKFDNNIWIVFSTNNIKTDTKSVYLRRCNNTMNTQDKYGNVHIEPCYIDYKVTENQIFRNYSIDVPSGRIQVQCQLNDYTKNININTRFIFGNDAYKVRERSRFDDRYTLSNKSVHYISFYADYDNLASDDNLEFGVANYKIYNYSVESVSDIRNIAGFSDRVTYSTYLDGERISEPVIWESSDDNIATITEDGLFTLNKIGDCKFRGRMKNKPDTFATVWVNVHDPLQENYETVMKPETDYIRLNSTEYYSLYEYKNYQMIDTKFNIECLDMPKKYYKFGTDGNNFYITNLKTNPDILLKLKYTNLRTNESRYMYIELGGIT